jgi:predicted nucleotidyltransferase
MRLDADGRALDVEHGLRRLPESAAARNDVDALWLFGSYGTNRQTPLSDVDIAVLPRQGTPTDIHWVLQCSAWLAELLATDEVDAVRIDTAPLWLQAEIVDSGRLLFVRDPVRLADYVEDLWRMWGDFVVDWREFQAEARRVRLEAATRGH